MKFIRISAIWCSSCILTYKNWQELQQKHHEYEYIEYDYDDDEEKYQKYNIGNILPVIIAFKDGKEIKRIIGEKSHKEWVKELESIGVSYEMD